MSRLEPYVKATEVVRRVPNLLDINGTSNIGLVMVSAIGPQLAYIQGPKQFLATYTIGGEIPRNADISFINAYYLSFFSGLVIARSMNTTAVSGVLFTKDSPEIPAVIAVGTEIKTPAVYDEDGVKITPAMLYEEGEIITPKVDAIPAAQIKILYKDDILLTQDSQYTLDIIDPAQLWAIAINDVVFFKGSYEAVSALEAYKSYQLFTQVEDIYDIADALSKWSGIASEVKAGKLSIMHEDDYILTLGPVTNVTLVKDSTTPLIASDSSNWEFSIRAKSAQATDIYKVTLGEVTSDVKNFELELTYPSAEGSKTDIYLTSLFMDAVDPNGSNSYIDNLNVMPNFDYVIEVFTPDTYPDTITESTDFGQSGLSLEACKKSINLKAGVDTLEDQVIYDIEYLAPVGITNTAFLKRYVQAGRVNYWFTPVDVPRDKTNANSIQMYMRDIDDSNNVYCCGPFDKNSGLTGWINYIACSTLYYERLMNNRSQGAEFAPIFDKEFGTIQMTNPTSNLGKTDREKLLNFGAPVNFAKYDQRLDIYYMNNNLTHQSVDDVMSEEQNRRIINKIKKDIIRLMSQFKGKYNTTSTREMVISLVTYYFQNNIMNKQFPPDAYNIVCDESNNPDELVRANKLAVLLQVRLRNSIKYIDILNEIFPLGVDFSQ